MRMLLAALVAISLISCGSGLPKNVLPQDKFREVMWDLTRGAEYINAFKSYRDSTDQKAADQVMYRDKILALHKVTLEQFDASYAYYRARPEEMRQILDSLSKKPQAKNIDTVVAKPDTTRKVDTAAVKKDSVLTPPIKLRIVDSLRRRSSPQRVQEIRKRN